MYAENFKEANLTLGAGDNPNTVDLPVAVAEHEQTPGVAFVISKWKMSPEEREQFEKTGEIYLAVMGNKKSPTAPPVFLTALDPFGEENGFKARKAKE